MQVGGAPIDDISVLIFNNIPTIVINGDVVGYNFMVVNNQWNPYIYKLPQDNNAGNPEGLPEAGQGHGMMLWSQEYDFRFRFRQNIIPLLTTRNIRGQTLHYLAGLKGNNDLIMFLYKTGREINREIITILNVDNSSVLHAIAWGVDIDLNRKFDMISNILYRLVSDRNAFNNIPNNRGETWRDNLMMRHPELLINTIIERIGF